jgi:SAM-dependent methyltransferase
MDLTPAASNRLGSVLHVGCGGDRLPSYIAHDQEVRLDINPDAKPDIVASMTDMGDIGPFDGLYTSHALEHLAPHDVARALSEFRRVLKPGGVAIIIVPDLEDVRPTDDVVYVCASGVPITGRDMYYGLASLLEANPYMAHRTGFVAATLEKAMREAGFAKGSVYRAGDFNLIGVGVA